jgi:hypothetical protein
MTEDLDQWAAEFMEFTIHLGGYHALPPPGYERGRFICNINDWHPTRSIDQAFMVVEKMREKEYYINLVNGFTHYSIHFMRYLETSMSPSMGLFERAGETARDIKPANAILLAAKAAMEVK